MGATVIVSVRIMHFNISVCIKNAQHIRYIVFTYPLKFFVFIFPVSTSSFFKGIKARINQCLYF